MHHTLLNSAMMIACVLLPFVIILWRRWPREPRSILTRWTIVVLLGWVILAVAGQAYGYLWRREWRITGVVPNWDPAFTMAFTLALGWLFPLLTSLPFIVIRECLDSIQRRRGVRLHDANAPADMLTDMDLENCSQELREKNPHRLPL